MIYAFFHDLGGAFVIGAAIFVALNFVGWLGVAIMHGNCHGGEVRFKTRYRVRFARRVSLTT